MPEVLHDLIGAACTQIVSHEKLECHLVVRVLLEKPQQDLLSVDSEKGTVLAYHGPAYLSHPRIAFQSARNATREVRGIEYGGPAEIYVMNADGRNLRRLTVSPPSDEWIRIQHWEAVWGPVQWSPE